MILLLIITLNNDSCQHIIYNLKVFVQQQAEELSCMLNKILLIFRPSVGLATVINRE